MKRISDFRRVAFFFILFATVSFISTCGGCGGGISNFVTSNPPLATEMIGVSAVAGNQTVTIGWSAVASATSYNIYRSLISGQKGAQIASVASSSTSYSDGNLTNETPYYYIVTAVGGAGEIGLSSQVSATPTSVTPATITITGTVLYQDKEYGLNGFTGNQPFKAVRFATVELVSEASSSVLYSAFTDSTGAYTIPSVTTAPTTTVYVRVKTEANLSGGTAKITVNTLSDSVYAALSDDFYASGNANVNIFVTAASIGGAFNLLDVFTNGFQFVNSFAGAYPPDLSAYWPNSYGTYYCKGYDIQCGNGEGIYVLNSVGGDTDEYDDDVLYHEFGHFTAAHFSQDDSPGGDHSLTNNDLDMRLAWSEGWGDSMPGNVKMWLHATAPNLLSSAAGVSLTEYVDTYGTGAQIAFDMGNPGGYPYYYATGEVAVAKILLDVNQNYGMDKVWSVIYDFQENPPATPVNLELFWDTWNAKGYYSLQSIFNKRQIFCLDLYKSDTFSTATVLKLNTPQVHYIYPDVDFDLVSFNTNTNQSYTVATSNLLNGADTYIEVYDQNQTQVAANDNVNGYSSSQYPVPSDDPSLGYLCDQFGICHDNRPDVLRSSKQFQATSSGPYYVKIYSSPDRPVSAGRYGTYTITITSP
jgi:hypothetical protein